MRRFFFVVSFLLLTLAIANPVTGQTWTAKLDDTVRFYQPTDIGAVIVGTKKSIYAVDAMTGDILWRRKEASLDENDIAPIPGTDLLLMSFQKGSRTRIEAIDALGGDQSGKAISCAARSCTWPSSNESGRRRATTRGAAATDSSANLSCMFSLARGRTLEARNWRH